MIAAALTTEQAKLVLTITLHVFYASAPLCCRRTDVVPRTARAAKAAVSTVKQEPLATSCVQLAPHFSQCYNNTDDIDTDEDLGTFDDIATLNTLHQHSSSNSSAGNAAPSSTDTAAAAASSTQALPVAAVAAAAAAAASSSNKQSRHSRRTPMHVVRSSLVEYVNSTAAVREPVRQLWKLCLRGGTEVESLAAVSAACASDAAVPVAQLQREFAALTELLQRIEAADIGAATKSHWTMQLLTHSR